MVDGERYDRDDTRWRKRMTEPTMRNVLDRLDKQERELTQLRAARTGRTSLPGGRKSRFLTLGVTALLVALVPLSILAATPFTDLDTDPANPHNGDIDTLYNLGITTGFENPDDPSTRLYYPKENVTREEMASFLIRTASINRMAYTSLPSAAATENLDNDGNTSNTRSYMTTTLTVPGQAGGASMLVKVGFTGYAYARSTAVGLQNPGCPCLLRGEITVDGETAGAAPAVPAQIVTRTVVGANPLAIVNPGPAERTDFSGSRVFTLAPGTYTFTMSLVRETGTAGNVGFGFGNMQAETVGFAGDGSIISAPSPSPSPSPSASPTATALP
jgi:hypothetical protein